jgi:hypothetical protein
MSRGARIVTLALALALAGCATDGGKREVARPLRTTLAKPQSVIPAQTIGNFLVIEAKWDRLVTLIAPALARRYPGLSSAAGSRRVMGADGRIVELPEASLRRLELGDVRFDDVPVLVYDCAAFSAHLGVRIDGVLGFPLFREMLLTLDYPGNRVVLQRPVPAGPLRGTVLRFDDGRKTPLIPLRLGDRTLVALIDSGSDMGFSLNPVGLAPKFAFGPAPGGTVGTIAGDRVQQVGRLEDSLRIGDHAFERPVVDISDELSAIGAGVLRHFAVTFDQTDDRVAFYRPETTPVQMAAVRSAGVSFTKTPAYWRVAGVVPKSPAEQAGIRTGDLVTRINGESVGKWDLKRYDELVATAADVTLTFLLGNNEAEKRVRVFDLIP